MNGTERSSACLLCAVLVVAWCGAAAAVAPGDTVPNGDCACNPAPLPHDPSVFTGFQCRVVMKEGPYPDNTPLEEADMDDVPFATLDCPNCMGCNPAKCVQEYSVTVSDTAQVSGTNGLSVEFKGEINRALSGAAGGIKVTPEFQRGWTNTSIVSSTMKIICGSEHVAPCTRTRYALYVYSAPVRVRMGLGNQWYIRRKVYGQPWGEWQAHNLCLGITRWVSLTGKHGYNSGCVSEELGCEACTECPPFVGPDPK